MSNECIHTHSNLAKSGIWSIDCEIWDMGYWGVKNLGYGILGVKNLGYGILGGKKYGIWDTGTPVSPPPPPLAIFTSITCVNILSTRQSEMANTSPRHMPVLGNVHPIKIENFDIFFFVTSFHCSLEFLYIQKRENWLDCYMLNVAQFTNDVKWRPIVTTFGTLIENMSRTGLYDCHIF